MYNHQEILFQFGIKNQVLVSYDTDTHLPIITA